MAEPDALRYVAFYLPQFHPIPENDEWWGPGFTEWTNVARANPLFRGHQQPHLPGDLGFYDLRLPETRAAQAALAADHGIDAFCYFHYWFSGRRLLERPFEEVLQSRTPELPFCLCWANERWTRVWDGKSSEVLIEQTYSREDDLAHVRAVAPAFADPRYLRIDGRPVFLVYRPTLLPRPREFAETWRTEAERLGLGGLYLCAVNGGRDQDIEPERLGMDTVVAFAPFYGLARPRHDARLLRGVRRLLLPNSRYRKHRIYDYAAVVEDNLSVPAPRHKLFPGVSPGFDNSPRRDDDATIILGSSPQRYEQWLAEVIRRFEPYSTEENLIFVNAWNEWAEGNHLEPSRRWERGYLEAHHAGVIVSAPHDAATARVIALYLPQFHPIPENDAWWGPGFSEWINVAKARPLYRGHDQPKIPADLGFYDLRVPEVRDAQAALAAQYGVEAFCYWHYWFAGRKLLERPFREVLNSGNPAFGFCLSWANQAWTAIWTGDRSRVLIEQTYPGPDDHERHFYDVLPAFRDPRYFRVDGRPLFVVYRPNELPHAAAFAELWRDLARKEGLPGIYLVGEQKAGWRAVDDGFDADVLPGIYEVAPRPRLPGRLGALASRRPRWRPVRYPYERLARQPRRPSSLPNPELPMVVSNWDNTARSGRRGLVVERSTPALFEESMSRAVAAVQSLPSDQRIVFVKSWNEWAEGNYVEPDQRHGRAYLEAIATAVGVAGSTDPGQESTVSPTAS